MSGPQKWQLAALTLGVAGITGWLVAWHWWTEKRELESRLTSRVAKSAVAPLEGPPASPSGAFGTTTWIKDKRTADLIDSFSEIHAGAKPGVPNERYLQAARGVLLDNNWERRTRNISLLLENLRPEDAPSLQEAFAALAKEGRPFFEEYRFFASRWGEVDGRGALEYFKAHPDLNPSEWDMRQVVKGWGQAAPREALAWLANNEEFSQRYQGAAAVLQGWSRQDPDAATAWLLENSSSPSMTSRSLSEIMLEQLYGKGLQGAGEWLAALPDNEQANAAKQSAWRSIQERFLGIGAGDAAALWTSVSRQSWIGWKDFEIISQVTSISGGGNNRAFLAAVAEKSPPGQISDQFAAWAAAEPELASTWLTRHAEDSPFRTEAIKGMVRFLEKSDPEAAKVWREQLPR